MDYRFQINDTFNGHRIRILGLSDTHIRIIHVPTGLQHEISISYAQELVEAGKWITEAEYSRLNFRIY